MNDKELYEKLLKVYARAQGFSETAGYPSVWAAKNGASFVKGFLACLDEVAKEEEDEDV